MAFSDFGAVLFGRLSAPLAPDEGLRLERVIASARAFVASTTLAGMWLDPAARSLGGPLLFAVLSIYLVYSAVAIVTLRRRPQATTGYVLVTHSIDLVAAASVTLASSGPNSPLFLLFIFALVAAAFRWGAWETLATAVVVAIILVIEAALLSPAGLGNSAVFHIGDLFVRAGYLLILG
ncbi:MAG TPA: hypothetical protein VEK56_10355, partial [Vicinamibacterales bacterium]|nr:hypothetical protein [Vicinamibacterales bacterium]